MADVIVERKGSIVTATLNRPESRNALSDEMIQILDKTFTDGEHDPEIRAYVIRGVGEHFMAGGDVKKFYANRTKPAHQRRSELENNIQHLHVLIYKMRRTRQPILASVRGGVAGFGMSLMMACDLAIAADDSFYTLAYCHIGLCPDGSSSWTLPRIVGTRKAMEIAMLGDRFKGPEALGLGLINKLVPVADLEKETLALATRLANGPTRAYGHMKRLIEASIGNTLETQLQMEGMAIADCMSSDDMIEGVSAFVEKRAPKFAGR
jgi:2-(1,2-epoxy-1,2-dihydrophenyl)acetyl-CoA isomerase